MKSALFIALLAASACAAAQETIDLKAERDLAQEQTTWGSQPASVSGDMLAIRAIKACPAGFEKLREYAAPEGGAWYLHFVVRCITPPATPVATGPTAPR